MKVIIYDRSNGNKPIKVVTLSGVLASDRLREISLPLPTKDDLCTPWVSENVPDRIFTHVSLEVLYFPDGEGFVLFTDLPDQVALLPGVDL
jgi:hypothetical protein